MDVDPDNLPGLEDVVQNIREHIQNRAHEERPEMDETEVQELEDEQDIEAIQELKSSFDPEILGFLQ